MTTDHRIDRLKAQMIEMAQKLDQLIEGQSKILAVFRRLDKNMDTTAEGMVKLTGKVNHLADTLNDSTGKGNNAI